MTGPFRDPPTTLADDGRGFVVIPDLHGRLDVLELVLERFPDRRYVFLGDLIDRGPDSRGVLNKARELVAAGRARVCMGNHEWMMLAAVSEMISGQVGNSGQREALWLMNGGAAVMNEYGNDMGALLLDAQWISEATEQWVVADGGFFSHAHRLPPELVSAYETSGARALNDDPAHLTVLLRDMPHLWSRPGDGVFFPLPEGIEYSVHGHTPQKSGTPLVIRDAEQKAAAFIDLGAVFRSGRFAVYDTSIRAVLTFEVER